VLHSISARPHAAEAERAAVAGYRPCASGGGLWLRDRRRGERNGSWVVGVEAWSSRPPSPQDKPSRPGSSRGKRARSHDHRRSVTSRPCPLRARQSRQSQSRTVASGENAGQAQVNAPAGDRRSLVATSQAGSRGDRTLDGGGPCHCDFASRMTVTIAATTSKLAGPSPRIQSKGSV
jgi:hypothetical protein